MKFKKLDGLSVFFPCYNEEENIFNTVNKALPIIEKIAKKWEIIIINDGSKDSTDRVAFQIKKLYPQNIKVVTHSVNRGYGAAFKSGLYTSTYPWIVFTDADGQFDFNDVKSLISTQQSTNTDMVIGYYLGRKVSAFRKFGTFLWQLAVLILFGLKVKDIDCGFKLISKKIVQTIPKLESERGPFITTEFLIKSKKAGFKIEEVGVHHFERQAGKSTGSNLNVALAGFKDLLKLWLKEILKW